MANKKIPKGWMDYLPYGDKVEGTKLFPFKTPLKLEHQSNVPKVQRFTPACLIANRPKLKAVIDLTDTQTADRYYCPQDFVDANIEHLKMRISGGGWVPGSEKIREFSDAVDGFLKKHADDPDALIGVHCTHGLNRTGYFICMYMVTRMSCNPFEAIDKFQKARGYEMYRQNFIEEIKVPGVHSNRPQTLSYGGDDDKTVRRIGDYSYQNYWLETPSRKPFKGFHESEIRGRNVRFGGIFGRPGTSAPSRDTVRSSGRETDGVKSRRRRRCSPIPRLVKQRLMRKSASLGNDDGIPSTYRRPEDTEGNGGCYRDTMGGFAHGTGDVEPERCFVSSPGPGPDRSVEESVPISNEAGPPHFFRFQGFAPNTAGYPPGPGQFHLGNPGVHEPGHSSQEQEPWTEVRGRQWKRKRCEESRQYDRDDMQYRSPLDDDMEYEERKRRYSVNRRRRGRPL